MKAGKLEIGVLRQEAGVLRQEAGGKREEEEGRSQKKCFYKYEMLPTASSLLYYLSAIILNSNSGHPKSDKSFRQELWRAKNFRH